MDLQNGKGVGVSEERFRKIAAAVDKPLRMEFEAARDAFDHPTAKGDEAELQWRALLTRHLPARYAVDRAFLMDASGALSEQIDLVIFDRFYSPVIYSGQGQLILPAESVYAVFEVKQKLDKSNVEAALSKAASVRRLERTSAPIREARGDIGTPRAPFQILAGVLALRSDWQPPLGQPLRTILAGADAHARLDLGCSVIDGWFTAMDAGTGDAWATYAGRHAVFEFILHLCHRLLRLGTVPALDYERYLATLRGIRAVVTHAQQPILDERADRDAIDDP